MKLSAFVLSGMIGLATMTTASLAYAGPNDVISPDRKENVLDRGENRLDRREDFRDKLEDRRDAKRDGGKWDSREDTRDTREDTRDSREDVRDRKENRFDRNHGADSCDGALKREGRKSFGGGADGRFKR